VTYRTLDAAAAGAAAEAVAEVVDAGPGWFVIAGDLGERLEVTEAAW
jgi:hypothetical protein